MAAMPERSEEVAAELRGGTGRFREDGTLLGLSQARRQAVKEFERAYLREVLAQAGWNYTQAARLAGVSRQVFMELAARHAMRAKDLSSEEK
jgi:DNA-binding NtrC family response regulator